MQNHRNSSYKIPVFITALGLSAIGVFLTASFKYVRWFLLRHILVKVSGHLKSQF